MPKTATMEHWIITNRTIVRRRPGEGRLTEVVSGGEGQPLPTFRIMRFTPPDPVQASNTGALDKAAELVPDEDLRDDSAYSRLSLDDDPAMLRASRAMLLSLYRALRSGRDVLVLIPDAGHDWPGSIGVLHEMHRAFAGLERESPLLVLFSVPTVENLRGRWSDQRIARTSGQVLGRVFAKAVAFLEQIVDPQVVSSGSVHLLAEGFGAVILAEACGAIQGVPELERPILNGVHLVRPDLTPDALAPKGVLAPLRMLARHASVVIDPAGSLDVEKKTLGTHGPRTEQPMVVPVTVHEPAGTPSLSATQVLRLIGESAPGQRAFRSG
ncbi:MAG: hypothetical protein AAGB51_03045 [Planctomycetota bacterium]